MGKKEKNPEAAAPALEAIRAEELLAAWSGLSRKDPDGTAGDTVPAESGETGNKSGETGNEPGEGPWDLLCVLGPTASGKTRYAVALARKLDALLAEAGKPILARKGPTQPRLGERRGEEPESGDPAPGKAPRVEILSADSRQVYRGMDIGTGKDLDEYGEVPYHLIDIVEAGEKYDLFRYQADFEKVYREIRERGNIPLLCGGTGLYIQAVTEAFHLPDVPADPELRAELEEADIEELREAYAERTEPDPEVMVSKKRLIRALEILLSGKEIRRSDYAPKRTFFIGLSLPKEELHGRIAERLRTRLDNGMVEEVRGLLDRGLDTGDLIYYGLEYKFITYYLTGLMDRETMLSQLETAIRHFAKRQMTFFRSMESKGTVIHWTAPSLGPEGMNQ